MAGLGVVVGGIPQIVLSGSRTHWLLERLQQLSKCQLGTRLSCAAKKSLINSTYRIPEQSSSVVH